jgi:hypothetical protein
VATNDGIISFLMITCISVDPGFVDSYLSKDDGFLRAIKIRSMTYFGGEVKPLVPCCRFTACKRTL